MKIVVLSMVGSVGKSTLAANFLAPRVPAAKFFSVENQNSGAEMDGIKDIEKFRGKNYGSLSDEIMIVDSAIVDVGASNFEEFFKVMHQYRGSHEEFDFFLIPVVAEEKCLRDTIKTLMTLEKIGVDKNKVRIVFNKVDVDDDVNETFDPIFGYMEGAKIGGISDKAVIYKNEIFDRIKGKNKSISDIVSDATDYRKKLKEAKNIDEKSNAVDMIQLKRLAISAKENMDYVFNLLFKKAK